MICNPDDVEWLGESLCLQVAGPRPFFVERDDQRAVARIHAGDFDAITARGFFADENRCDDFVAKVYCR